MSATYKESMAAPCCRATTITETQRRILDHNMLHGSERGGVWLIPRRTFEPRAAMHSLAHVIRGRWAVVGELRGRVLNDGSAEFLGGGRRWVVVEREHPLVKAGAWWFLACEAIH